MRVRLEYARDVITRAVLREQIRHVIADVRRACDSASVTAVDASVQRPPDREQSASNDSRTRVMRSCWVLTPQGYLDQHHVAKRRNGRSPISWLELDEGGAAVDETGGAPSDVIAGLRHGYTVPHQESVRER